MSIFCLLYERLTPLNRTWTIFQQTRIKLKVYLGTIGDLSSFIRGYLLGKPNLKYSNKARSAYQHAITLACSSAVNLRFKIKRLAADHYVLF